MNRLTRKKIVFILYMSHLGISAALDEMAHTLHRRRFLFSCVIVYGGGFYQNINEKETSYVTFIRRCLPTTSISK